jgi:predicted enzyme related to lactoylglutathione lyase
MISGVHTILYSTHAEAVRAFFRDVLKFPHVDAGQGWLIFAAPPGEIAVHPADEPGSHELYLMCTDIKATIAELERKGVEFTESVSEQDWGLLTHLKLPDGEKLGLYEPRHKMAIKMKSTARRKSSKAGKITRKPRKLSRKRL